MKRVILAYRATLCIALAVSCLGCGPEGAEIHELPDRSLFSTTSGEYCQS